MADDDKSKENEDNQPDPKAEDKTEEDSDKETEGTDEAAKWKALARKHEKDAKANAKKLQEIEDAGKSEAQKAADRATNAEKDRDAARDELAKVRMALKKGITGENVDKFVKRLHGSTEEELEADADELAEFFKPEDKGGPASKPREDLRGGGDPTEDPEETDPRKLAEMVPRY